MKYFSYLPACLFFLMLLITGCGTWGETTYTSIEYNKDSTNFRNPERGWYHYSNTNLPLTEEQLYAYRADDITLVRVTYILDEYRNKPITQEMLYRFESDLVLCRKTGFKLIPRFYYVESPYTPNCTTCDEDAPLEIVQEHIDQLKPIILANWDLIAWMEPGFVGWWGEWHHSTNAHVDYMTLAISESGEAIIDALLDALPPDRMTGVRYPDQLMQLYPTPLNKTQFYDGSHQSRLGHFNDGYFAGESDFGTYPSEPDRREAARSYLSQVTNYVVMWGEPGGVPTDDPDYYKNNDFQSDLRKMHWTTMNRVQSDAGLVYRHLIESGEYEDISRFLGYRFRLVSATLPDILQPGASFSTTLVMVNDGYARVVNPRGVEIVLRNQETGMEYLIAQDDGRGNRLWLPAPEEAEKAIHLEGGIPQEMPSGKYAVFFYLPDPTDKLYGRADYAIRLANEGVWDPETGYNTLDHTLTIAPDGGGQRYKGDHFFVSRTEPLPTPIPSPTPKPTPTGPQPVLLVGLPFGADNPVFEVGREYDKAFDGDIFTFYDAEGRSFTGIDLGEGEASPVTYIRFYPRAGWAGRMVDGEFQGSNESETSGFTTLYIIDKIPPEIWNEIIINDSAEYRYLRYISPQNGWGNVAEIEFYSVEK